MHIITTICTVWFLLKIIIKISFLCFVKDNRSFLQKQTVLFATCKKVFALYNAYLELFIIHSWTLSYKYVWIYAIQQYTNAWYIKQNHLKKKRSHFCSLAQQENEFLPVAVGCFVWATSVSGGKMAPQRGLDFLTFYNFNKPIMSWKFCFYRAPCYLKRKFRFYFEPKHQVNVLNH